MDRRDRTRGHVGFFSPGRLPVGSAGPWGVGLAVTAVGLRLRARDSCEKSDLSRVNRAFSRHGLVGHCVFRVRAVDLLVG